MGKFFLFDLRFFSSDIFLQASFKTRSKVRELAQAINMVNFWEKKKRTKSKLD